MLLFPVLTPVRCISQVMQFQHCNHSNAMQSAVWVCLWIFLLFFKWSAFVVYELHDSWLLICFALDGYFFEHCHLEFAHFFDDDCQYFFFVIVAVAVVVVLSLLHSTLIRLMSRCAYKRLISTGAQVLSWYKSNSTHLNHHWNGVSKGRQREREREREKGNENIYLCASGHAWKRDKCVVCTWHGMAWQSQNAFGMSFKYLKTSFKSYSYLRMYTCL